MISGKYEPKAVLGFFEKLCAIPHGSGNTKGISDYCERFAKIRALEYYRDELGNIIIIKPASKGYGKAPAIIIQGHLDMVCATLSNCKKDMKRDTLDLEVKDGYLCAKDTTLGADDGAAVAIALALLDDKELAHPRLEVILTVDEETGMSGAKGIDLSHITAKTMLNIDSEQEGVFTVSCAGGTRAACTLSVSRESMTGLIVGISIDGLTGGHSGEDIAKGRANAAVLLGRILKTLSAATEVRIFSLSAGEADNAIPTRAAAKLAIPSSGLVSYIRICHDEYKAYIEEFNDTDPKLCVLSDMDGEGTESVVTLEDSGRIIEALCALPNGVQKMSAEIENLPQTSLNIGTLALSKARFTAGLLLRSSVGGELDELKAGLEETVKKFGGEVEFSGEYPAWELVRGTPLQERMTKAYTKLFGKEPTVAAIHAGLECGIFAAKIPELDCVSIGPDILEIHTPRERMNLASLKRTWEFVLEVLRESK